MDNIESPRNEISVLTYYALTCICLQLFEV